MGVAGGYTWYVADRLTTYRGKRDFAKTKEPAGKEAAAKKSTAKKSTAKKAVSKGKAKFVIQMHDATRLHYDFRLEDEGVLKSWAVPKGPSTDPQDKRLAVPTEDHPMEYRTFEGVIAEGEYGAGPVIVWDAGTFRNMSHHDGAEIPLADALERGHAVVWLEGKKLNGAWALNRFRRGGSRDMWLLVKQKGEGAGSHAEDDQTSVRTGRTLEEVADGKDGKRPSRAKKR